MGRPSSGISLLCLVAVLSPAVRAQDSSPAPSAQPAEKKVWTNDDVSDLRAGSPISTVGTDSGSVSAMSGQSAAGTAKRRDAKWYRDQILKLQNQLPALNDKIAQLQAGIDGKATGDGKQSTRPLHAGAGDWQVELAQLQKQRDDIEARINTLQVQARRAGIPANALP